MKNILFYIKRIEKYEQKASYRIWFEDLSRKINELGINSQIVDNLIKLDDEPDAIILYKGQGNSSSEIKDLYPNTKIGLINPILEDINQDINFVIVGSTEEKTSLLPRNENIFIINLIEDSFSNCEMKIHSKNRNLFVGFHGSSSHLNSLNNGLVEALEKINGEKNKFELLVCTENNNLAKEILDQMPFRLTKIKYISWSISNIEKFMNKVDIGLVTNLSSFEVFDEDLLNGTYKSDYLIRFKNKSNPGRAFVFIQFGIPVITDLTPSMLPIYFDEECGYIGNNPESFYLALKNLSNPNTRNIKSKNAYERFTTLYSFENDVKKLINYIYQ
jgi:glycosyltransferase involved in cell wall biosynthesis